MFVFVLKLDRVALLVLTPPIEKLHPFAIHHFTLLLLLIQSCYSLILLDREDLKAIKYRQHFSL